MGHRLSKTTLSGSNVPTNKSQRKRNSTKIPTTAVAPNNHSQSELNNSSTTTHELGPTINLITDTQHFRFETRTDPNSSNNGPRQIIIKIQLAKMEAGENDVTSPSAKTPSPDDATTMASNNNLNVERSNMSVNAITFRRNIACDQGNEIKLNNLNVGPSVMLNNNNNNSFVSNFASVPYIEEDSSDDFRNWTNVQNLNIMVRQMGNCHIVDNACDIRQEGNNNESSSNRSSTSSSEFNDVMPVIVKAEINEAGCSATLGTRTSMSGEENRRKKSSSATGASSSTTASTSSSSAYPSKWRCRDALKKLRPSKKQNQQQPSANNSQMQPLAAASSSNEMRPTTGNHLAIWSPANDVIIPLASPQIVVVQYPNASAASHLVTLGPIANIDDHAIRLMAGDLTAPTTPDSPSSMAASPSSTLSTVTTPNGTVVHSQVDYIHCLVPDLERITKSTFYWGKMDRYEAERLLDGKPEGTFLLRDSAQEEYLFSVTFRKYERSLHARIEQFNHRFSFDCHDPGVFTASTVTGLLEHYKDPSCVMFFEPMLTIPLHRNTTFTLQQLCRATVVSNTTYDGITELEIPTRLKSYLKEYHYKQRVRVKPFDEPFYSCT